MDKQTAAQQVRDIVDQLKRPIPDFSTLVVLLSSLLSNIGLLPPKFRQKASIDLPEGTFSIPKHLAGVQVTLLDTILPTWEPTLAEEDAFELVDQFFCPDSFSFTSTAAGEVALVAYGTLMSQLLKKSAINILTKLVDRYPIDRLHAAIFSSKARDKVTQTAAWEDAVRSCLSIPPKAANAIAGSGQIPSALEQGTYFNNISTRVEQLVSSYASQGRSHDAEIASSISYLLSKLVTVGVFPSSEPTSRSESSFFKETLGPIRERLQEDTTEAYSSLWKSVLLGLPTSTALRSILVSLLGALHPPAKVDDLEPSKRALVKNDAMLLYGLFGQPSPDEDDLWEAVSVIATDREWNVGYARLFACWIYGKTSEESILNEFLQKVVDVWSSPLHVKHSLLSQHQYLTAMLLICVSYLTPSSSYIQTFAFSPPFINGIGKYVGHPDQSVRRCGMLAAEVVAQLSGKKLDFKDWEGDDPSQIWARNMRKLISQKDADANDVLSAEILVSSEEPKEETAPPSFPIKATLVTPASGYDSDDSMAGYDSPPSSRSASPAPEELEEIANDPTLNVGKKKVARPVYLAQLGDLLRNTGGQKSSDDPDEADKLEMALNCAEELIRRKRSYGTELEENAVNLVYGLVGLQDNYDLEGFDDKRQDSLTALVACCPRKAAPAIIEEFFKNQYSMAQRYAALNALALGARELASLPVPVSKVDPARIAFPSRQLAGPLHQRYLTAEDVRAGAVPAIMDSISSRAIEKGKDNTAAKVPQIVRERKLRIGQRPGISEVSPSSQLSRLGVAQPPEKTTFTQVATEFFIAPMINRFWVFLRDEQTREQRTAHLPDRQRYQGAGTGLVLNPTILSHFLRTLAVLVHAGQNAPEWMAIVAPDALELAVTIGTRPISHMDTDDGDAKHENEAEKLEGAAAKEAAVLTSSLELALVVLDGCLEVDGGRVLGLEHTTLLLGASEWASEVFNVLEKGVKVEGGGGLHEAKLKRTAAGVVLKIDELTSRWRRSMLDTR